MYASNPLWVQQHRDTALRACHKLVTRSVIGWNTDICLSCLTLVIPSLRNIEFYLWSKRWKLLARAAPSDLAGKVFATWLPVVHLYTRSWLCDDVVFYFWILSKAKICSIILSDQLALIHVNINVYQKQQKFTKNSKKQVSSNATQRVTTKKT